MVKVEKQADKAIVWIYAYVGDYDFNGPAFQLLIDDLVQTGCTEALIRIHTYGGIVFDGNMIGNTIENAPFPIDIQIDGVCASMGSIIMLKARKISIVANGFVMIHTPSSYCEGNADMHTACAKLLTSMQGQFITDLSNRTGKDETYTAKWMDGQDHWMSADELLAEGLVDEIVQSASEAPEELTVEAVSTLGAKAVFTRFTAALTAGLPPQPDNTKKTMDKQRIIDKYKLTGVTADSTDEEVEAALEAHISGISKAAEKTTDDVIEELVEALGPDVTAEAKTNYKAIGAKMGVAVLKTVLKEQKPYTPVTAQIRDAAGNQVAADEQKNWDWDKYQKENPKALEALEKSNQALFAKLYTAKYGNAPK